MLLPLLRQSAVLRLTLLRQRYAQFSKDAGLKSQYERTETAGFGKREKPILENLNFAQGTSEVDRLDVEQEIAKLPKRARELAEPYISEIIVINDSSRAGGYLPSTGQVFLHRDRNPGTVAHEYGHAIEKALNIYNDEDFLKIRKKGFENLSRADIIIDSENFSQEILRVWNKKLVSLYQGRLYVEGMSWIYEKGKVTLDGMREYFSEGFSFYVHNPALLKRKDQELYDYIRRMLG